MSIKIVRETDSNSPVIVACGSGASFGWGDCGSCSDDDKNPEESLPSKWLFAMRRDFSPHFLIINKTIKF